VAGADLHLHSTASDGRFPPREVVRRAFGADLRAISLTDHDTIAGIAEAAREAIRLQIDLVPGCEISINHDNTEIHLLAYYINPSDAAFRRMLTDLHQAREERLMKIVELLRAQSVPISLADIRREAIGTAAIGRLHIARALVRLKVVKHFGAAFRDWLGFGGKAFVPKQTPHPEAVIDCIWSAGGVPVLAHPGLYRLTDRDEFFAD